MALVTDFSTYVHGDTREEIESAALLAAVTYLGREPYAIQLRVETTEDEYGPPAKYKAFVSAQ